MTAPITNNPLVSIIIPAKNEAEIIGNCLSALIKIDFSPQLYEVIVIDNGSVDETMNIAKKFGARVFSMPAVNISKLRNYGANKACGKILAFVDADVLVERQWLNNAIKSLDSPEVGCVGSSPKIPDNSTWVEQTWHLQISMRPAREYRNWIASMNMIIPANIFKEIGGFNEKLITCEDVDFGYRLSKRYKIIADKSIGAVHLGEAKTLWQLFLKESWRGMGNFDGLRAHGFILQEFPSHAISLFYTSFIFVFPVSIILKQTVAVVVLCVLSCVFPLLKALIVCWQLRSPLPFLRLVIVWMVYSFARGFSMLRSFAGR